MNTDDGPWVGPRQTVLYARDDYASWFRRTAAAIVDLFALCIVGVALNIAWVLQFDLLGNQLGWLFWPAYLGCGWFYLAVLKSTPVRTVGYLIAGIRVVDRRGRSPGVVGMTVRLCVWFWPRSVGPNVVVNLLWPTSDRFRQTIGDKLTQTYVVRSRAKVDAVVARRLALYDVNCVTLAFFEPNASLESRL